MATLNSSSKRGATTQWVVTAWTTGGNIPDVIVRLQATPASAAPKFSFGCGSNDGTASCDLGAIDAGSVQRQLQVESKVPATASSVNSVALTVIGSAAKLPKDATASATVQISGTVTSSTPSVGDPTPPITSTSPLPVGSLPEVSAASGGPTLSPGGNASDLFPTLAPSASSSAAASKSLKSRPVADSAALPEGASVVGASLIGLVALALAFVLAVTRFSIRRPASAPPAPTPPAGAAGAARRNDRPAAGAAAAMPAAAAAKPTPAAAGAAATETAGKTPVAAETAKQAPATSTDIPGPTAAPETSADALRPATTAPKTSAEAAVASAAAPDTAVDTPVASEQATVTTEAAAEDHDATPGGPDAPADPAAESSPDA